MQGEELFRPAGSANGTEQSLEEALGAAGYLVRPVEGDSMMPMLDQRRDFVKIVPLSAPLKKIRPASLPPPERAVRFAPRHRRVQKILRDLRRQPLEERKGAVCLARRRNGGLL